MNNDNKKVYIISNDKTKTLDDNMIRAQEEITRRSNTTKTILSIIIILITSLAIIVLFKLLDGLGKEKVNNKTTTIPITLNETITTSTEQLVYTPRTTMQTEEVYTYSR